MFTNKETKSHLLLFRICIIVIACITLSMGACVKRATQKEKQEISNASAVKPGIKLRQYGFLRYTDLSQCDLSTGCGSEYSLLGEDLSQITPLAGKFSPEHHNLLVEVSGKAGKVNRKYREFLRNSSAGYGIKVKKYRLLSEIPYHQFLIKHAELFTTRTYGCSVLWDKTFGWDVKDNRALLKVKMTNTSSPSDIKPFLQLTYDGITGHLLNQELEPWAAKPCG